jgi:hypothetical protein
LPKKTSGVFQHAFEVIPTFSKILIFICACAAVRKYWLIVMSIEYNHLSVGIISPPVDKSLQMFPVIHLGFILFKHIFVSFGLRGVKLSKVAGAKL